MKQFVLQGIFVSLGLVAACSSGGSSTGAGGAGGTGTTSSSSSSTSTTTSSTSGSTSTSSSGGGTGGTGTGGADPCPGCVVIASQPANSRPYGLAIDDANVYWTNSGSGEVMQAKKDGSGQVTLASGVDAPHAVTVAGGFVYWGQYSAFGALKKAPIGGGTAITLLASAPAVLEMVAEIDYLWWTREPDDVQRMPTAGLPEGGVEDLLTGNPLANGIAVDATNVYWVNQQDGYVKKSDRDLGNVTPLATGDVPWGVAIDGTNIYWTEQGSAPNTGKVMKASKADGSGVTMLATGQAGPQGIALDSVFAYWANKDDGTINKIPIAGGTPIVIASMQQKPIKIAVDDAHVFWTSYDGGRVVRAPK